MSNNIITYFISFFFAGIAIFVFVGIKYPLLYILWVVGIILGIVNITFLFRYANKNGLLNKKTSFFWAFNEEYNDKLTRLLIALKCGLFALFIGMCVIPIKELYLNKVSLIALVCLIVLVIEKSISAKYQWDYYEVKFNSWENYLTKDERIMIYKSRESFLTIGILPLIVCCLYGNMLLKGIVCFFSFMIPIILGHLYPALYRR